MRLAADRRARLFLVAVLVLLALGLSWHLVGAEHHVEMGVLQACLAALVTLAGALLAPTARALTLRTPAIMPDGRWAADLPVPVGRHPPDLGTVLRR